MHWGVRKNSSGSSRGSSDHRAVSSLRKKKVSDLSNDELKKLTTRLNLETQYKNLTKANVSSGQKFIAEVLQGAGKSLASKYVATTAEKYGAELLATLKKK